VSEVDAIDTAAAARTIILYEVASQQLIRRIGQGQTSQCSIGFD
jgi:hypothetical protein